MIGRRHALQVVLDGLSPDAGGPEAVERRRATTDWAAVLRVANAHLVGPAMYAGIADARRLGELPDDVRDYLGLLHERNRSRNAALQSQAIELVGALNDAGIRPLLLKGGLALFLDLYPDSAARMIRDLDVLVPPRAIDRALGALRTLNYREETRYPAGHHAYGDFVRPGAPGAVDLHFEPTDGSYILSAFELTTRARIARQADVSFLAPAPTDCVLHHLLHAQIHHLGNFYRGVVELRQLYEFAILVRRFDSAIDWDFVIDRMARHRLETALASYALAAHRLLALEWPLPGAAPMVAELHYRRCILQLIFPAQQWIMLPVSNLRAAFAWHRMHGLYGDRPRSVPRLRHAARFLRKGTAEDAIRRLFQQD